MRGRRGETKVVAPVLGFPYMYKQCTTITSCSELVLYTAPLSNSYKLPLKATQEVKEKYKKSFPAAKKISVNTTAVAGLTELDGIFTLKATVRLEKIFLKIALRPTGVSLNPTARLARGQ